jgi:hypothetical protein
VTIRSLLHMVSGIPNYSETVEIGEIQVADIHHQFSAKNLIGFVDPDSGKHFPPSTGWFYSNTNYILAGLIIEAASGMGSPAVSLAAKSATTSIPIVFDNAISDYPGARSVSAPPCHCPALRSREAHNRLDLPQWPVETSVFLPTSALNPTAAFRGSDFYGVCSRQDRFQVRLVPGSRGALVNTTRTLQHTARP